MALKFFDDQNTGNGQTSFLNDWLEENPKNKQTTFEIIEIKRVQSDKGYLVITDKFAVFLWKNSKICKFLIEALDSWVKNPNTGYGLYVILKNPTKADYQLASDTEKMVTWFTSKNGYTTLEPDATSLDQSGTENPFL